MILTGDYHNNIMGYFWDDALPEDSKASRALRDKASRYCLVGGQLYWRSFHGLLAKCLGPRETYNMMRGVHEGSCGNHSRYESLVQKLMRVGYYSSRMKQDTKSFMRKCNKCKWHDQMVHQPVELLHLVLSPWPFRKWGIDIVGTLPPADSQVIFC